MQPISAKHFLPNDANSKACKKIPLIGSLSFGEGGGERLKSWFKQFFSVQLCELRVSVLKKSSFRQSKNCAIFAILNLANSLKRSLTYNEGGRGHRWTLCVCYRKSWISKSDWRKIINNFSPLIRRFAYSFPQQIHLFWLFLTLQNTKTQRYTFF